MKKIGEFFVKYDKPFDYLQLLNYLVTIFIFAKFWLYPDIHNAQYLSNAVQLFVTEFLLVTCGAFMAVFARSWVLLFFIYLFGYLIYDIGKSFQDNYFFFVYLGIVLLRMRSVFTAFDPFIYAKNIALAFAGIFFYLIAGISMAIFENYIPALGITENYLVNSGFKWQQNGSGLIVDKPYLVMYFFVVYFT